MTNITLHIDGVKYFRVTKTVALRKYLCGEELIVAPHKVNPSTRWCNYSTVSNPNRVGDKQDFEKIMNAIRYYNCNPETGYYLSYYVRFENDLRKEDQG